jgi:hypothetical protein
LGEHPNKIAVAVPAAINSRKRIRVKSFIRRSISKDLWSLILRLPEFSQRDTEPYTSG